MVFFVGIGAAVLLGLGYVLQQRVAATAPLSDLLSFRLLLDVMRRRLWWAGIGAMAAGEVLAGLALQMASVALVEPLLSANLLFALLFANLLRRKRICWQEICGAALLSAALGVFIAVGNPHSSPSPAPNTFVIVLAVGAVIVATGILVLIGKRRGLVGESIMLSTGAGLLLGLQDAATRAGLGVADHGIGKLFYSPWPYIVVGSAVIGLLLSQSAFKAARLDYSLPPIAAAEPLVGILLGVTVLGDVVSVSAGGLAVEAVCVAVMLFSLLLIARSPGLAGHHLPGIAARQAHLDVNRTRDVRRAA